ncbi:FOR1 protein [Gonium pectorale]|uniref:FOR1 protein n=1 Tax=Gonium pectorale TaxID=33097 RepID=A0A150H3R5_GONPE|nr:FOR1 protein [Gonium pectorale]|eukprot:KXZ56711.1 FOR1 protein [Gonium pectorale]
MTSTGVNVMDEEKLEAVLEMLPTEDEQKLLVEYKGDRTCLNEADKFLLEVLPVACEIRPKIQICMAMAAMPRRLDAISKDVAVVCTACDEESAHAFVTATAAKVDALEVAAKDAERAFIETRGYLNGSNDKTELSRFFFVLHSFAVDLAKAHRENSEVDARPLAAGRPEDTSDRARSSGANA